MNHGNMNMKQAKRMKRKQADTNETLKKVC